MEYHYQYLNKHYNSLNDYLKRLYGEKVYKICLDGCFTCPNRDGQKGTGGCIFCNDRGIGDFLKPSLSVTEQLKQEIDKTSRSHNVQKFIAYFQNFTGTYGDLQYLENQYLQALSDNRVVVLSIATRPDCVNKSVLDLLSKLHSTRNVDIWIELGLQTINDSTAKYINRCYETEDFYTSYKLIRQYGFSVIPHIMFGLPKEGRNEMLDTVRAIAKLDIQGIKFHCLSVLKGTALEQLYRNHEYTPISLEAYAQLLCDALTIIPKSIVIHRLISDFSADSLVAPEWASDKLLMLNTVAKFFACNEIQQGMNV